MTAPSTSTVQYDQIVGRMIRGPRTKYQVMREKVESLQRAEANCVRHGSLWMAFVWRRQWETLECKLKAMTVEEAWGRA